METEEFGILGLGDCEDIQDIMSGLNLNCGDGDGTEIKPDNTHTHQSTQYRQNVNPKSELFVDISERLAIVTYLLATTIEAEAAAEEATIPENTKVASIPGSTILEKMKRELVSLTHLSDKVSQSEETGIHVLTSLVEIVNCICVNWRTEKGEISFESEDVYAEILVQFLEMVSEKVQVLKLDSNSKLSEIMNSANGRPDIASVYSTFTLTLLDFLGQSKKFKIPQQTLQIIHSTLRQVWIFLKSQNELSSLILKNVINPEEFKLSLTDDREYGIYCLLILLEMFHGSYYEHSFFKTVIRWILEFKESKNITTFLTIFIPFVKPASLGEIVKSEELISHLRAGLLSNSPTERKETLFVLKSLTSNQLLSDTDNFLFKQNSVHAIKFWVDFFDLFEILDEKQIHIIKPVLPKLQTLRNVITVSNVDFGPLHWYFVLLKKMVGHDNRFVAREGLINFFEAAELIHQHKGHGHDQVHDQILKDIFKVFLRDSLLPALKESVGWILPEAQDFFEIAKRFGSTLNQIYDQDFVLIADGIMSFINGFDVGLSPHAIFFLILTMSHSVVPSAQLNFDPRILQILDKFTQFLLKGITALDKFLRLETQKLLVQIFCKIFQNGLEELLNLTSQLSFSVLNFLGALDYFAISILFMEDKLKATGILQNSALNVDHLNSTQVLGLSRLSFLIGIIGNLEPLHILTKFEETQIHIFNARLDFLKIVSSLTPPSTMLISEMQGALHYWKSEQNFRTRYHPVSTSSLNLTFEQCQTILDFLVEYASITDYRNELLGIVSDSSHVLSQQFQHLGENVQSDYEVLKFHIVLGKFFIFHEESSFVEYPATFFLENFSLVFDRTNISSNSRYGEIDDKFRAEFVEARLSALSMILQANEKRNAQNPKDDLKIKRIDLNILKSVLDQIDLTGPQGIIPVMEFVGSTLSFIVDDGSIFELLEEFLTISWNGVFELRKTESFWIGVRQFVKLIVHPYFAGRGILDKYARQIFDESDTITGISLVFLERIYSAVGSAHSSISRRDEFIRLCEEAICFAPPLLKHIKGTYGLWEYLQTQRSDLNNSVKTLYDVTVDESSYNFVFHANVKTRLLGIKTIARIVDKDPAPDEVLEVFVGHLLDKNDFESVKKRRYFGNSCTHRIKHRISQALLVLQPMFNEALSKTVIFRLMSSLARDSPQPSVRYFMEWIIIRCLVKYPGTHESFFKLGDACYKTRVGFGSFLSTICLHASVGLKNPVLLEFTEKSLRALSTLLMGQHFTVRLYARVCFRRIYENAVSSIHPRPLILNKFEILYENVCADNQQPAGNVSKISQHIDSDFYVEVFNASEHYFFEVVFIYLPKIAGMASDELIQENELIHTFGYDISALFASSKNMRTESRLQMDLDKKIRQLYIENERFAWHLKAVSEDGREMGEETPGLVDDFPENSNFQKKLNPWKFLSVALEISDFPEKLQLRKSSCEDGLIVVASLVDRIPNLGGLCRTCEIFGVSKYVISRLKALDDKQFQNLSVSAQKWIDILEVPPNDLDTFLSSYSKKGYKILGVEQALESVPLNEYTFPKKSVLLLGNEKYGIPPHLLHLVNQCLEIPQVGVVRSLNVHVTGALCIWQYAMQHTVKTL